ncbi:MAG: OmpA family protein [Deltaproteobacteria bacterium]|nr:OmpA family protein [Deltaproteobacteria bacterium]
MNNILTLFFTVLPLVAAVHTAGASALRELDYFYNDNDSAVTWQVIPAHVICSSCSPIPKILYHPANVENMVVRVKASMPATYVDPVAGSNLNLSEVKQIVAELKTGQSLSLPKESSGDIKIKEEVKGCPASPVQPQALKQHTENMVTVHFGFDSFALEGAELNKLRDAAKKMSGEKIVVRGYTCDVGTKEHNNILAIKRALSVYEDLIKSGIDSRLVMLSGTGKCCYVGDSKDKENRRVEIITRQE